MSVQYSDYCLTFCFKCPECNWPTWLNDKQLESMNNIVCNCGSKYSFERPNLFGSINQKSILNTISPVSPDISLNKQVTQLLLAQGFDVQEIKQILSFANKQKLISIPDILKYGIASLAT